MTAVPYKESNLSKKEQVEEMFDHISPRYDLLNHLLSLNIDKIWRKKAVKMLNPYQPKKILDVATGTADFAIAASKLSPEEIIGIDLSEGMLQVGRQKIKMSGLEHKIKLMKADSEKLPFASGTFDAAIVGFGVRNFENLQKGLVEICRVLKPDGVFIVLEFSKPQNKFLGRLYSFYFTRVLPRIGRLISKNSRAYTYLPESVKAFPDGADFTGILSHSGFSNAKITRLSCGIASIYKAQKPALVQ